MAEYILIERRDVLYAVEANSVKEAIDKYYDLALVNSFSSYACELTVKDSDQNVLAKKVL